MDRSLIPEIGILWWQRIFVDFFGALLFRGVEEWLVVVGCWLLSVVCVVWWLRFGGGLVGYVRRGAIRQIVLDLCWCA